MLYVEAQHSSRPCTVTRTNANGSVDLVVTDGDGSTFPVLGIAVVAFGATPPAAGFYAQAEQTPEQAVAAQNELTLRQQGAQALIDNRTFLAIANPTNAQVIAQVRALTRVQNGVIRLILRQFDGTN